MRYIGLDIGDGESAVAGYEAGSGIEPVILPVCGAQSILSAVGFLHGQTVIGEQAYTEALADQLSVRFKSRFTMDPSSHEDFVHFVSGILQSLEDSGLITAEDRFVIGCPAGWNAAERMRCRELLIRAGVCLPQIISESRAAFLYARYAHTAPLDLDLINDSALVADIGSSTLDFAYIVDGRETAVGTFGETALGGGILDAVLLRRAVERSRDRDAIQAVFSECSSWYSYCEIETRRLKEAYFTQLANGETPVVQKQLRICYDGVQKLMLKLDEEEISHAVTDPLPDLAGRSFSAAIREALENAARLTADRPPKIMLLTGGASRMPFFRQLCTEIFDSAVIISCPEPEFSIAKGLAYAGWVDEKLRAFRQTLEEEISEEQVRGIAAEGMAALLPAVAHALTDLLLSEAVLPAAQQWQMGGIRTLEELNSRMADRISRVLSSTLAQEALAPAVKIWLDGLAQKLQALVDPICDRYDIPRKQMQLDLTAAAGASPALDTGSLIGLPVAGTVFSAAVSVIAGILCGGSGMALVASGPLGFLAGMVIGMIASLLGWNALSAFLMKLDVPLLLRQIPLAKSLTSTKTRSRLQKQMLDVLSSKENGFEKQVADGFARAFQTYLRTIARNAEIPIE